MTQKKTHILLRKHQKKKLKNSINKNKKIAKDILEHFLEETSPRKKNIE